LQLDCARKLGGQIKTHVLFFYFHLLQLRETALLEKFDQLLASFDKEK